MKKGKGLYSILNAGSAIGLTLVNGLLGIIVTRFIISIYGSDFNGLNSTANQIINVLLVLEGGFTLASNVAIFPFLSTKDYKSVNGILISTKKKFKKIGILFLVIGFVVSLFYAYIVKSNLSKEFITAMIIMSVLPQAVNLYYATTYRVLLQAEQKEYIISIITMITIGMGHITNILIVAHSGEMWTIRFVTMIYALINSFLIIVYVKTHYDFLDFKTIARDDLITGTEDVMIQKITGVIYNAVPIVFLSISPVGGTMIASVYAVYNNVFIMVKSLLHGIIDAPRLGIGQLLAEKSRKDVWEVFKQYEFASFFFIYVFMTTTCALILPFIDLYTVGVNDINYYDIKIAILMVLISTIEMLHIPSGHLINMAGKFDISKKIQAISCIILIISLCIGGSLFSVYGMLSAILLTAILLAVLEIMYVHKVFFQYKVKQMLRMCLPMSLFGFFVCVIEIHLRLKISGYVQFIYWAIIIFIINLVSAMIINIIFNKVVFQQILNRVRKLIKSINK